MKILYGKLGSGKTYSFPGGYIFDVDKKKDLDEMVQSAMVGNTVLINVWYSATVKDLIEYKDVPTLYFELHENIKITPEISPYIKLFKLPTKKEMFDYLGGVLPPKDVVNWYDLVNYKKYDTIPPRISEKSKKFYVEKLGWSFNRIYSNSEFFDMIEECFK